MSKRISLAELRSRLKAAIDICADSIEVCGSSENPQTRLMVAEQRSKKEAFEAVLAALNGNKILLTIDSTRAEQKHTFQCSIFSSPWGSPNSTRPIAPGIIRYDTPSHGGYQVSFETEELIPECFRKGRWYEQDCDWAILAFFFPNAFPEGDRALAIQTLKHTYPDQWEAYTGETILPGESYKRDRAAQAKSA